MIEETKLTRHRAKQKKAGITRFSVQLDNEALSLLRWLCHAHNKTQGEFLRLAIMAADSLLAGRLRVAKAGAPRPQPALVIARQQMPQERAAAPSKPAADTSTPPAPENAPTAAQRQPEQAADDVDARIRAAGAAWIVEP